jgi:hypothetical protein
MARKLEETGIADLIRRYAGGANDCNFHFHVGSSNPPNARYGPPYEKYSDFKTSKVNFSDWYKEKFLAAEDPHRTRYDTAERAESVMSTLRFALEGKALDVFKIASQRQRNLAYIEATLKRALDRKSKMTMGEAFLIRQWESETVAELEFRIESTVRQIEEWRNLDAYQLDRTLATIFLGALHPRLKDRNVQRAETFCEKVQYAEEAEDEERNRGYSSPSNGDKYRHNRHNRDPLAVKEVRTDRLPPNSPPTGPGHETCAYMVESPRSNCSPQSTNSRHSSGDYVQPAICQLDAGTQKPKVGVSSAGVPTPIRPQSTQFWMNNGYLWTLPQGSALWTDAPMGPNKHCYRCGGDNHTRDRCVALACDPDTKVPYEMALQKRIIPIPRSPTFQKPRTQPRPSFSSTPQGRGQGYRGGQQYQVKATQQSNGSPSQNGLNQQMSPNNGPKPKGRKRRKQNAPDPPNGGGQSAAPNATQQDFRVGGPSEQVPVNKKKAQGSKAPAPKAVPAPGVSKSSTRFDEFMKSWENGKALPTNNPDLDIPPRKWSQDSL